MKKQILLFVAFVCLIAGVANAQKMAFGAHVGFSKLASKQLGRGGGLNYILEGRYFLTPQFSVGAEYNASAILAFILDTKGGEVNDAAVFGGKQFLAKAQYNFLDKRFTPYAGIGLGYSGVSTPDIAIDGKSYLGAKKAGFGISPRLGLKLGGFNLEWQYNLAGKTPLVAGSSFSEKKFNFNTFTLGYVYTFDKGNN